MQRTLFQQPHSASKQFIFYGTFYVTSSSISGIISYVYVISHSVSVI